MPIKNRRDAEPNKMPRKLQVNQKKKNKKEEEEKKRRGGVEKEEKEVGLYECQNLMPLKLNQYFQVSDSLSK